MTRLLPTRLPLTCVWTFVILGVFASARLRAQDDDASPPAKTGVLVSVDLPLRGDDAAVLVARLAELADATPPTERQTVVLQIRGGDDDDGQTAFEDALRVARAMTSGDLRRLRIVVFVRGRIGGHASLIVTAAERLVVGESAVLTGVAEDSEMPDETVALSYQAIARRRGLFPESVVDAMLDRSVELVRGTTIDGRQTLASGDELKTLRDSGEIISEDVWKSAGQPIELTAEELRDGRMATDIITDDAGDEDTAGLDQLARRLDLASITDIGAAGERGPRNGVLLEIAGSIASNKSRRWQSNLQATLGRDSINTWLITFDTDGGSLGESAGLATWFASPQPPLETVAGFVRTEARGDAALIALACKPLMMAPDSRLGGAGADAIDSRQIEDQREFIETIARRTNRSPGLIMGLLDRDRQVYRYTSKKTGRVRYSTPDDLVFGAEDEQMERDRWRQGERIDLSQGVTAETAMELGLIDGIAATAESAARRIGLDGLPPPAADRGLVRLVEDIGRRQGLAFLALMLGFMMLSSEASAPGMGLPGFLSMICFAFFFWTQYLNGTAEWLELLAFVLGLVCIGIEIFVLPGFGIFGIGGLALTLLGVVLMSQTFVVPRNVYQVEVLTQSIWMALGGLASTVVGFLLIRRLMPHLPILSGLVMETSDAAVIDRQERLADYADFIGQSGKATTPLRPSGKARFGDQIIAVVSDGQAIERDEVVRVIEVLGTRVVVEPMDSPEQA